MTEEIIYCPSCNHKLRVPEDLLGTTVQCPMCNLTFTAPTRAPQVRPMPPQVEAATPPPLPGDQPPPLPREAAAPTPPPSWTPVPRESAATPPAPSWPPPGYGDPRIQPGGREPDESGYPRRQPPPGYGPPRSYGDPQNYYDEPRGWEDRTEKRRRVRHLVAPPAIFLIVTGVLGILINLAQVGMYVLMPDEIQRMQETNPLLAGGQPPPPAVPMATGALFAIVSLIVAVAGAQMMRFNGYTFAIIGSILAMVNCGNLCCLMGLPVGIWAMIVLIQPHVREAFD